MIRVDVLGGLHVGDGSRVYRELPHQPMRAALLVMLAVDRTLTRDQVLATLWPDRDADRGRRALNQTVYELRRTLGEGCIVANAERLSAGDELQSDVGVFELALANRDTAAAVESYRGPFLAGFFLAPTNEFEDWTTRHRSRLARAARKARLERIDELVAGGRHAQALACAQRAVDEDPLEDDYQHRLIQLLLEAGERAAALRQFQSYRARLGEQGLKPLEHTSALIHAIRADERELPEPVPRPPVDAPPPADTAPADGRDSAPSSPVVRWRRVFAALAVLAALALGGLAVLRLRERVEPATTAETAPSQLTVILFEDASPEPRYGYLARGISESLVHGLQRRVPRLRVVAVEPTQTGAAARLPGTSSNLRLDGTIAVDHGSVSVRVRLSDMATGELLRPIEVRRPWVSELALIDSIVPAVIEQMQPILGQQIRRRELRAGTRSAEAFALYLRAAEAYEVSGRFADIGDGRGEESMLAHVDSLLERADHADPDWSRIPALRARTARRRALLAAEAAINSARPRALLHLALRHADEAVARNPADADALTGRAKVRYATIALGLAPGAVEQRRALAEGARSDVHRAVTADPLAAEAWLLLAYLNYASGDWQGAHAAALQAYQTDAFLRDQVEILSQLALSAFHLGRDQEAARWCSEGATRYPGGNIWLDCRAHIFAYARPPALDSALALVQEAARWPRHQGIATIVELNAAYALAVSGHRQAALDRIAETRRLGFGSNDGRYLEAAVHAALGDTATALRLVQEYYRYAPGAAGIMAGRPLQGLRSHPGFPAPYRTTR